MKLLSIQVGKPRDVEWEGKKVTTGIFKSAITGPVRVRRLNIDGDGQADLKYHGGEDKAVYAYSYDAYPWWKKALGVETLEYGAFGENLTISRLNEKKIAVGDVYLLGSCKLQAVEPRFPCSKLGIKFRDMRILKTFMKSGRPGIYFRVIEEGEISVGDELKLVTADPAKAFVFWMFELRVKKTLPLTKLQKMLQVKSLTTEWRKKFSSLLRGG